MRSGVIVTRNDARACLEVRVTLADEDLAEACLGEADRTVLRDCGGADRTAADMLLALEIIFRRMREQQL